jgi:hypothetical protein
MFSSTNEARTLSGTILGLRVRIRPGVPDLFPFRCRHPWRRIWLRALILRGYFGALIRMLRRTMSGRWRSRQTELPSAVGRKATRARRPCPDLTLAAYGRGAKGKLLRTSATQALLRASAPPTGALRPLADPSFAPEKPGGGEERPRTARSPFPPSSEHSRRGLTPRCRRGWGWPEFRIGLHHRVALRRGSPGRARARASRVSCAFQSQQQAGVHGCWRQDSARAPGVDGIEAHVIH